MADLVFHPNWEQKMRNRFKLLDVNKDGFFDNSDIDLIARNIAKFRGLPPEEFFMEEYKQLLRKITLIDSLSDGPKPIPEDEFVEKSRIFVSHSDARFRIEELGNAVFDLVDANHDQKVTFEEIDAYYRAYSANDQLINEMFEKIDINRDGIIERQECIKAFQDYFFTPY